MGRKSLSKKFKFMRGCCILNGQISYTLKRTLGLTTVVKYALNVHSRI